MKESNIHCRVSEQTAARLSELAKGSSKTKVLESLIFLGEKIDLVKAGDLSLTGLLFFLDFTFDTHLEADLQKGIETFFNNKFGKGVAADEQSVD